jgi:hypothetical protein
MRAAESAAIPPAAPRHEPSTARRLAFESAGTRNSAREGREKFQKDSVTLPLSLLVAALCTASPDANPALTPHRNVLTLDPLFLAVAGRLTLGYERAASQYTSIAFSAGYRFGGVGTSLLSASLDRDNYDVQFTAAARFFPLGRAPQQLFLSPGLITLIGRETRQTHYTMEITNSAFFNIGWAWHFFDRWALILQTGPMIRSFALFRNDSGVSTASGPPVIPFLGISTGVAL